MNVACSTLCFGRYPLERALRIIGELEFSKLDVAIHEDGPHLTPSQVVQDIGLAAQRIRIGPSLTPGAFSDSIHARSSLEQARRPLSMTTESGCPRCSATSRPRPPRIDPSSFPLPPARGEAATMRSAERRITGLRTVSRRPPMICSA